MADRSQIGTQAVASDLLTGKPRSLWGDAARTFRKNRMGVFGLVLVALIVLTAIFDRARHKYGERGYRYVYMEAGHISQNIFLQAVSLGLGSVAVGAFLDQEVNRILGIDGREEAAIYLHAVGAR